MLNKLLSKLNGHAADAETLAAALDQLGRDLADSKRELGELKVRRHQALLDDALDATLDKLEREIERTETRIEKLQLAEPGLRSRLQAAKDVARERGIDEALEAITAAFDETAPLLIEVERRMVRLFEMRSAAVGKYGARASIAIPEFGLQAIMGTGDTVKGGHIARWSRDRRQELEERRAARSRKSITLPRPARMAPVQSNPARPAAPESFQHQIVMVGGMELSASPRRAPRGRPPDDREALQPGEVRVKVLRNGYSARDDQAQCAANQIIRMPAATAERAQAAGVIEILERAPADMAIPTAIPPSPSKEA